MTTKRVSVADRLDAAGISNGHVGSAVEQLLAPADVRVEQVPVDLLYDHPDNPRGTVGDVDELADSIKANGIFEPLIVVPADVWQQSDDRLPHCEPGDFVVIAGHRRKAAAVQAGLQTVPCIVRADLVGGDAEVAMLVENVQREDLSPIQEARGFAQLEARGMSQREIARATGKQQPHVSKRLSLLRLPDDLQAKVGTDDLAITDAVELAKLDDPTLISDVLRNRKSWQSIADAAEDAADERQRQAVLKDATDRVKAGGERIVKWPIGGLGAYSTPRSLKHLADEGVDVAEHEHFACHAVAIGYAWSGSELQVTRVCTNPKAHPESRDNREATARDKQQQQREKEQADKERRSRKRRELTAEMLKASPTAFDDIVARRMLDEILNQSFDEAEYDVLAEFLGVPRAVTWDVDNESRDDGWDAMQQEIERLADADPWRVLRAAVVAQVEISAEYSWGGDDRAAYLKLLQSRGHKLTGPERHVVQTAAPKPEPVEVPASDVDADHEQLAEASEAIG